VVGGKRRGGRRPGDEPRKNRAGTEPRANTTDPGVRVMRNQKGYVAGYNGQFVVTAQQIIVGAALSQHPVDRTLLHPLLGQCRDQLKAAGIKPRMRTVLADSRACRQVRRPARVLWLCAHGSSLSPHIMGTPASRLTARADQALPRRATRPACR
jgi:hypothetical protein